MSQQKKGAEQVVSTVSSPTMGTKVAFLTPRVAAVGVPLVYNAPDRAAFGRQALAAANAPKLSNPMEILECSRALIRLEDGFAIVGPTGACFARANSMTTLIPWFVAYAQQVDGVIGDDDQ